MAAVLILLTFLLPLGAGAEEIIGGHEVKPHYRPYMAFIVFVNDDGKRDGCGGFLVKDNFVLTAAHCMGSAMNITLGAHNISIQEETQQIIPVAKAIPHPDYNPKAGSSDIMLLKGDSGGPLVCKKAAAGIVSLGDKNDSAPCVFTRVSSFLSWIKKTMNRS
ncbi:granzyme C-like isoform X2 [Arvicola amphibius]|uniref:granzyme C-like isoform X2 n=1 Tax=Arvicola amphibius TaxID=1047088 RepID=UPI0018E3C43B|nr:granzyme C-like isoform X2 [Arvicola amphibius]